MLKYHNLKIQDKLIASFAVILLVVLVLAISNYMANTRIHTLSKSVEENAYMAYKDGSSLMDDFTKLSDTLTEAIGFSDSSKLKKAEEIGKSFSTTLDHLKTVAPGDAKDIEYFGTQYSTYINTGQKIVNALSNQQENAALESGFGDFGTTGDELRKRLQKMPPSNPVLRKSLKQPTSTPTSRSGSAWALLYWLASLQYASVVPSGSPSKGLRISRKKWRSGI